MIGFTAQITIDA